jgi:hypothetical protein
VTVRLESDFRRAVPLGTELFVRSEVVARAGRKIYLHALARMDAPDGPVAVEARALFLVVPGEHFEKHAGEAAWRTGTRVVP